MSLYTICLQFFFFYYFVYIWYSLFHFFLYTEWNFFENSVIWVMRQRDSVIQIFCFSVLSPMIYHVIYLFNLTRQLSWDLRPNFLFNYTLILSCMSDKNRKIKDYHNMTHDKHLSYKDLSINVEKDLMPFYFTNVSKCSSWRVNRHANKRFVTFLASS